MTLFKHVVDEEMPDAHVSEGEHKMDLSKPFYEDNSPIDDAERYKVKIPWSLYCCHFYRHCKMALVMKF